MFSDRCDSKQALCPTRHPTYNLCSTLLFPTSVILSGSVDIMDIGGAGKIRESSSIKRRYRIHHYSHA